MNCAWDLPVEVFRSLCRDLDDACERVGRDPSAVSRSIGVTVLPGARAQRLRAVDAVRARAPFLASLDLASLEASIVADSSEECASRIAVYGSDEVIVRTVVGGALAMNAGM